MVLFYSHTYIYSHFIEHFQVKNPYIFQTGTTALFFAAQGGHLAVVKDLISNNAQVDLASTVSHLLISL